MPCDRRCCRSAAADRCRGGATAKPAGTCFHLPWNCRRGGRSRRNCGRPVQPLCPGYFSKASRSVMSRKSSMTLSASVCASAARSSVVASATICPAPALRAASIPAGGVFEDDAFRRSQPQGRGGRKVNLRVGFAARDHVAADPGVEIRLDAAFFQHEIHIGLVARRTYGAAYACVAEPCKRSVSPGIGTISGA